MMSTEKPLVTIRRRKKALKEQQNSENKDPLQEKETNLADLKENIITAFGQTADLKIDDIKIAETDGMLFFLESMIGTDIIKRDFYEQKNVWNKTAIRFDNKGGINGFLSARVWRFGFSTRANG